MNMTLETNKNNNNTREKARQRILDQAETETGLKVYRNFKQITISRMMFDLRIQ